MNLVLPVTKSRVTQNSSRPPWKTPENYRIPSGMPRAFRSAICQWRIRLPISCGRELRREWLPFYPTVGALGFTLSVQGLPVIWVSAIFLRAARSAGSPSAISRGTWRTNRCTAACATDGSSSAAGVASGHLLATLAP